MPVQGRLCPYHYEPFGGVLWQSGPESRLSYIDKEKDGESGDHNFGVRQYDNGIGRFMAIDPLWEKYRSLSPYNYAENNPVLLRDPSGLSFGKGLMQMQETQEGGSGLSPRREEVKKEEPKSKLTRHGIEREYSDGTTAHTEVIGSAGLKIDAEALKLDLGSVNTKGELTAGFQAGVIGVDGVLSPKTTENTPAGPIEKQTLAFSTYLAAGLWKGGLSRETTISRNLITDHRDTVTKFYRFMAFEASLGGVVGISAGTQVKVEIQFYERPDIAPFTATVHARDVIGREPTVRVTE